MQAGGAYVGVVLLSGANVDVTGAVDAGGTLVLTGIRRATVKYDPHVEVSLSLRHDAGTIAGDLQLNGPGISTTMPYYGQWSRAGSIISATKVGEISDSLISDFTGTWDGNATVRSCSTAFSPTCNLALQSDVTSVELTLTRAAGGVTGLLMDPREAPVEGPTAGATVQLAGVREQNQDSRLFKIITAVRPSSLTRDAVGRLRGTLNVEVRSFYTDLGVITHEYIFELIDVVLRPPS
jgi:hypothetical protein